LEVINSLKIRNPAHQNNQSVSAVYCATCTHEANVEIYNNVSSLKFGAQVTILCTVPL
jgi:hypothetical protein